MALLSQLSKLGSSDPVELKTSIDEIISEFDLGKFGSAPTKFDEADLMPLTSKYLQGLSALDVAIHISNIGVPIDKAEEFWNIVNSNITTLNDLFSDNFAGIPSWL